MKIAAGSGEWSAMRIAGDKLVRIGAGLVLAKLIDGALRYRRLRVGFAAMRGLLGWASTKPPTLL